MYNMKIIVNGSQKQICHEARYPKTHRLLKAYLHIVRRGINFGKLSRVPTCNIQMPEKLYMSNDTILKYNSFRFKTWVCMRLDFLTSNFNALVKFRVGLEYAHTYTPTHTPKTILFKTKVDV